MANIVINIPDSQLSRVVDGLSQFYGYSANVHGNNKGNFVKSTLLVELKERVKQIEAFNAAELAAQTAKTNAEGQITLS